MGKKVTTYGLLSVVLVIWGYVVSQILAVTGENEARIVATSPLISTQAEDLTYYELKDSLSLSLAYRDPMLIGDIYSREQPVEKEVGLETTPMINATSPPIPKDPEIVLSYLGYIENESNRRKVAILDINGRQCILGVKESHEGVLVLRIEANYITIRHQQKTKTLYK